MSCTAVGCHVVLDVSELRVKIHTMDISFATGLVLWGPMALIVLISVIEFILSPKTGNLE